HSFPTRRSSDLCVNPIVSGSSLSEYIDFVIPHLLTCLPRRRHGEIGPAGENQLVIHNPGKGTRETGLDLHSSGGRKFGDRFPLEIFLHVCIVIRRRAVLCMVDQPQARKSDGKQNPCADGKGTICFLHYNQFSERITRSFRTSQVSSVCIGVSVGLQGTLCVKIQ